MYARGIKKGGHDSLKPLFSDHISPEAAIKTDEWKGTPLLWRTSPTLNRYHQGRKE